MAKEYILYKGTPNKRIVQATVRRELGPTEAVRGSALGHEGIGVVEELGSAAHALSAVKVGDRVGMGWMQRYCGRCHPCMTGHDSLCENSKELWDMSALHQIPDALEGRFAAPLMCAGATVWGSMQRCRVMSHHRVGVLGVGGLGNLAIQFLAKSGCEVVIISSSERKRDEAMEYGADEYWTIEKINEAMEGGKFTKLDHLLICTGAQPDYTTYMPLIAMGGSICPLTVDFETTPIPLAGTVFQGINIIGAKVANRSEYTDIFRFAVRHKIQPTITEFAMTESGLNDAIKALQEGKAHYRAVAVVDS